MRNSSTAILLTSQGKTHAFLRRLTFGALLLLATQFVAGQQLAQASAQQLGATGRVTVHFALSHGGSGAATWSDTFRVIKASAQQFSGCAIETDRVLHSRELVVHVWPRTTSEFLTRDFKLTVSLTSSGAVTNSPVRPTVALGFHGTLYSVVTASTASKATVRNGGREGTFDIHNVFNSSTSTSGVRITGTWSCTGMLRYTTS
jgi:hypothetical protein